MTQRNRTRKSKDAPKGSTREKGDIVEQIVASMHKALGVKVERNVFLPAQDGSNRIREIDVLLSSQVAGYPVRVAVECKNEKQPVGIEEIDEFIGKLQDVGIPTQQGIFVSASGYRSGAASRAEKASIRSLVLKDITTQLPLSAQKAFQSLVYLQLVVTSIHIQNDVPEATAESLLFRNEAGRICGTVPDLIWQEWLSGHIPDKLGDYQINLELPKGWLQVVSGKVVQIHGIMANVRVAGYVVTFSGKVRHLALVNATSQRSERKHIDASFEIPPGTYPVAAFSTEEELDGFLSVTEGIRISLGRFRIPRIVLSAMYWPPSERSVSKIMTPYAFIARRRNS